DAWSMQVLIREIGTLYNAIVDGEPPALPRLPIQYADFACWQRRWLRGEVLDDHLAYWRRRPALRSPAGVARHSVGGACPSRTGDRRGHVAGVVADRAGIGAGVVYVDDLAAGLWASRARRVCPGGVGVAVVGGRDRCVAARSSPVGGGAAGYRAARRVAVAAKQPRILRGDGSGAADRAGDPVGLWWRCRSVDFRHHG
ncbi:MAG: hypothetical protein GY856_38585, partial [bacterium]|nr:hypothetical protein [bacterium]